jgi:serine phosphatase RsbU (regulator of sigma subunit)
LARYLLTMREVATRLASAQDARSPEDVAPVILAAIGDTLDWDLGGMWVVQGDHLRARHQWAAPGYEQAAAEMEHEDLRLESGQGIPGRVLASGEAAWIEDLRRDTNFPRRAVAERHGLRSAFAFPIETHGRVIAVVEFCSATRRDAEPHLLPAMASAGAEIGRLIEREDARRQAAQAREHLVGMAQALQASLLPPHPPVIPGLQIAARYRAAAGEGQVGGDFFDVFPLGDGGWAVAIGDVSGRGPKAAALTALARYTLRAAVVAAGRGSDVLRVLNDVVFHELQTTDELGEQFLTVAFLILRPTPSGLSLQLVCGGHPYPLVLRESGEVEEAVCVGELVGVFDAWEADDVDLALGAGEALVLYTDGAFEGRGPDGEFGQERLRQVIAQARGMSAEEVANLLEGAVLDYIGEESQDDMAILVLRVPGGGDDLDVRAAALTASV